MSEAARVPLRLELPGGWIEGRWQGGQRVFLGLRYAAAPEGEARWQSPRPVAPWAGTLACDRFGPLPVQAATPGSAAHQGDFDLDILLFGKGAHQVRVGIAGPGKDAQQRLSLQWQAEQA